MELNPSVQSDALPAMRHARVLLPFLLLLSGFSGIAYEILYIKLLGNLLGNQFTINATVLMSFLLGIGLGSLYAYRLLRLLWAVEAGIGIYAALMAAGYGWIESFLYQELPFIGANVIACAFISFVLLLIPAFLIGCSIPLFASYLGSLRHSHVFSTTYAIYNFGGALTVLLMEFVLLRSLGLHRATLLLAAANGVIALAVFVLVRTTPLIPTPPRDHLRFPSRVLCALALASASSAVFQLLMLKLAEFVFGPYNESFSLVLANVLLGLAIGSVASTRTGLSFRRALFLSLAGLTFTRAFLPDVVSVYAWLHARALESYPLVVALKFVVVFVLMGAPAIGFGAMIPSLLRNHRHIARESGQLLFISSMANAVGFLLMGLFLHRYLDYGPLLLLVAMLTVAALLIHAGWRRPVSWTAMGVLGLAAMLYRGYWDEESLYVGHTTMRSLGNFEEARQRQMSAQRFKGAHDVFAIIGFSSGPGFFINGYFSVSLDSPAERVLGALSSMLAPRADQALVLGVGSGATAGVVGLLFDHTDAVEISQPVIENLDRMAQYNFDIEHQPNVTIIQDDGVRFVKSSAKQYSLIVNTTTTPRYFSSSKLYTRDFFEAVRQRLTPDGVYVTWLDSRVGENGVNIILETLASAFEDCWLGQLGGSYFFLACAKSEVQLRQLETVAGHEQLRQHFADAYTLPLRLLPYSIVSTDALELRPRGSAPVNTLDFPVLEFEMARLGHAGSLEKFVEDVRARFDWKTIRAAFGRSMRWQPAEFLLYADLRGNTDIGAEVLGSTPETGYDRAASALAREMGTVNAYYAIGESLRKRQRYDAAIAELSRVVSMDASRGDAHYALGESHYSLAAYDQALAHYSRTWELDRDERVPLSAGRALIELARYREALEWLETAEALGVGEADVAYYRGVVHEGLNDVL
ncbi:MAG: spermine synthase, partial [Lysobacterales bacterium]